MRLSVFWSLMDDEFGPTYSRSLARDHSVLALGDRTVEEALEIGIPPKDIWDAVCEAMQVPAERRFGKDRQPPRR